MMPRDTGMSYLVFIKQLQFSGMSGLGEGMRSTACQFSHWRVMLMLTEVWICRDVLHAHRLEYRYSATSHLSVTMYIT